MLTRAATHTVDTRRRVGDVIFVLFALAQGLDVVFTYVGIATFGSGIEANPVLSWYIAAFGASTALIGWKLLAIGCGVILHQTEMHRTMGALVALYALGALWPWTLLLWGQPGF